MKRNIKKRIVIILFMVVSLAWMLITPAGVSADTKTTNTDTTVFLPLVFTTGSSDPLPGDCMTSEEALLANLVNDYRNHNGLPAVPVSKTMLAVGQWHVLDLETNHPDLYADPLSSLPCNLHSWSDWKPSLWSAVCYTDDHANASGMWLKPYEISGGNYLAAGYENAYWDSWGATAQDALEGWKYSPGHNAVILEQGIWVNSNWAAMGMGIYNHYAVLWFGEISDPNGTASVCQ